MLRFIARLSKKSKNGDFGNLAHNNINKLQTSKFGFWDFPTVSAGIFNVSDNAAGSKRDRAKRASRPVPARVHPFVRPQSAI
jgi:hypothetical protein